MVYCPALIGQLNGTGWFNPIDEGNSSKGGRGYFSVKALTQAPTLRLPYPEKAFQLYVHKNDGIGLGVLSQRLGPEPQPVAIQEAGPNHWGWPPCLWNLAATAVLIEDALKLSLGGKLTIFTSHQVKQLLNGKGHLWMSDQVILRYQVVLMKIQAWLVRLLT